MVEVASTFVPVFEQWPNPVFFSQSWYLFEVCHALKSKRPLRTEPGVSFRGQRAIGEGKFIITPLYAVASRWKSGLIGPRHLSSLECRADWL